MVVLIRFLNFWKTKMMQKYRSLSLLLLMMLFRPPLELRTNSTVLFDDYKALLKSLLSFMLPSFLFVRTKSLKVRVKSDSVMPGGQGGYLIMVRVELVITGVFDW